MIMILYTLSNFCQCRCSFYKMLLIIIILHLSSTFADESIIYASIIYRHGDRTPVDTYPTDPWRNESLWPVKFGELTNTGKKQHYALGQWFRKRYAHLLSDNFDRSEIYIRSTDVDRTLMSAEANLAGMYPPIGKSVWDKDLMWQPIPVHTMPEKQDEVLAMEKPCKTYSDEMEKFKQSNAYLERLSQYQALMDYLTAHTGREIKDYSDIMDIYSILYIETLYNFTLPNWTQSVYPNKLKDPACYSFTLSTATSLLARLKAGPLLKDIVSKMIRATSEDNSKSLKLSVYSGHDFTIGTILNGLRMYDGNCPVYTATVLMELIYDNATSSHFIRISYRNSTDIVEPHILAIPYCGKKCPVERFIRLYENLYSVDFDHECNKQYPALLEVSLLVGLGIIATICVAHLIYFYKVTNQRRFPKKYSIALPIKLFEQI